MMKVVALVSGGKDSCFSIHLCEQHGHQVVALANLLPPDNTTDELDSYMYQTVGHQLVAAYAACTGLPLYRRRIMGRSNSQGLSYSVTGGDEVEDLYLLLAYIKEHHPELQAVASGAIASDYQRLRVENVCSRLGLVSLAYLWHQPQDKLLSDMISNGIEAVLVKVAALGLDPHKHLGKTIQQLQPLLRRLRDQFGCNVCGEGGEYETLTLDCRAFKYGRIVLDDWQVVLHSPDSIAAVGVLHPTAFHIKQKQQAGQFDSILSSTASTHQEQQQQQLGASQVVEVPVDWQPAQPAVNADIDKAVIQQLQQQWDTDIQVLDSPNHLQVVCSVAATAAVDTQQLSTAAATASALGAAMTHITACLSNLGLSWCDSLFVHLYLGDMRHFSAANDEYCRHMPHSNPPSRACVQVPLPAGCPVLLDVLVMRKSNSVQSTTDNSQPQQQQPHQPGHRVLHVQSISSWAPSCIGPYSQASSCNGLIHMAGQIPLDPATMTLVQQASPPPPPGTAAGNNSITSSSSSSSPLPGVSPNLIACQAWRTLRSCQAVAVAVKSCVATASLALTVYLTEECAAAGGQAVVMAAVDALWRDRTVLDQQEVPLAVLAAAAAAAAAATAAAAGNTSARSDGATDDCPASDPVSRRSDQISGDDLITRASAAADHDDDHDNDDDDQDLSDLVDLDDLDDVIDDYLQPPAVLQVIKPDVLFVTVPALPRGSLLEIQPILVDLAAAQQATASSSSSSEDVQEEEDAGVCDDLAACNLADSAADDDQSVNDHCAGSGHTTLTDSNSSDHVICSVSPSVDTLDGGSSCGWTRVLLHLLKDGAAADPGSDQAAQVAVAMGKLSGLLTGEGGSSSRRNYLRSTVTGPVVGSAVCMVRCYYEVASDSGKPSTVSGCVSNDGDSLKAIFLRNLQQLFAAHDQGHQVAVQCVPVSGVASSASQGSACWGIVEVLLR